MPVRSREFFCSDITLTGGLDTLYTVPADRLAVVKDIRVRHNSGTGDTLALIVVKVGPFFGTLHQVTLAAGAFAPADPPPWAAIGEGGLITAFGTAGAVWRIYISGALLDGDPA